jgi:hypothetical protein
MGAPTTSIFSEIYLLYMEHTTFVDILNQEKNKILGYFHYVGEILIVYDKTVTDIENIIQTFNSIHLTLTFSKEDETDNPLIFLDVTLRITGNNILHSHSAENLQELIASPLTPLVILQVKN